MLNPRKNQEIIAEKVHLIDEEGNSQGVISRDQALLLAYQGGFDLVQVSQKFPPVCRLIDFGKYKYEQDKRERKSKSKNLDLKEVRMKLAIEPHDLEVKKNKMIDFLKKGHKVKLSLMLKGRELAHFDRAYKFLEGIKDSISEIASEEKKPSRMGRQVFVIYTRKP